MADEPRKPERKQIPSPEELEAAEGVSPGDVESGEGGGRIRASFRRFGMRLRGGVGKNKTVAKAPRVSMPSPTQDDTDDIALGPRPTEPAGGSDSQPTGATELGQDQLDSLAEEPQQGPDADGPQIRRVRRVAVPKRRLAKTPAAPTFPEHSPEARGQRAVASYGHTVGTFAVRYRDRDSLYEATCVRCGDDVTVVVEVPDNWNSDAAVFSVRGRASAERLPVNGEVGC